MIVRTDRWESAERYYELYAGEDLFGEAILVKVWGGKGSGRGGSRTLAGPPALLERERRAIAALRRRHGYAEVAFT
jgi:hypothetical protein